MKPRILELPFIALLAIAAVFASARASVVVKGIENATCELARPGVYTINFQSVPETTVEVFASSQPDRIDSTKPVGIIRNVPANISVPNLTGRIYFHLKSPT